jgi:hypothetical protein
MATTGPFRTQNDLITEVLAKLGILSAGQPIDPEDYNYVSEMLDGCYRMMGGLDLPNIPDPQNIPSLFFLPLADIVAGECATKFGATPDDHIKLKAAGLGGPPSSAKAGDGAACQVLRAIQRGRPTGEILRAEFF